MFFNFFNDNLFTEVVFWASEAMHFSMLVLTFYSIYRIVRYKYTPYTNLYVSGYFGSHVIYNGCPITLYQNFLTDKLGQGVVDNIFFRTNLGDWEDIARVLSFSIVTILLYTTYKQFMNLQIPPRKWLNFWDEFFVSGEAFQDKRDIVKKFTHDPLSNKITST